jgi:hypothetical protein
MVLRNFMSSGVCLKAKTSLDKTHYCSWEIVTFARALREPLPSNTAGRMVNTPSQTQESGCGHMGLNAHGYLLEHSTMSFAWIWSSWSQSSVEMVIKFKVLSKKNLTLLDDNTSCCRLVWQDVIELSWNLSLQSLIQNHSVTHPFGLQILRKGCRV